MSDVVFSFDFDGVLSTGKFNELVHSLKSRKFPVVITTGRCFDEADRVYELLEELGLDNLNVPVYFNTAPIAIRGYSPQSTSYSGAHKATILNLLSIYQRVIHFEDEEEQIEIIRDRIPNSELGMFPLVEDLDLSVEQNLMSFTDQLLYNNSSLLIVKVKE